jgi:hypothetical protein
MQSLNLKGKIDTDGHLRLDLSTALPPGDVEIVVVIYPTSDRDSQARNYDFSDLAGTLIWQGDAVAMQRKLRDEW